VAAAKGKFGHTDTKNVPQIDYHRLISNLPFMIIFPISCRKRPRNCNSREKDGNNINKLIFAHSLLSGG
jgi:hypothetical protein